MLLFFNIFSSGHGYRFLVSVLWFSEENAQIAKPMSNLGLSIKQINVVAQVGHKVAQPLNALPILCSAETCSTEGRLNQNPSN